MHYLSMNILDHGFHNLVNEKLGANHRYVADMTLKCLLYDFMPLENGEDEEEVYGFDVDDVYCDRFEFCRIADGNYLVEIGLDGDEVDNILEYFTSMYSVHINYAE